MRAYRDAIFAAAFFAATIAAVWFVPEGSDASGLSGAFYDAIAELRRSLGVIPLSLGLIVLGSVGVATAWPRRTARDASSGAQFTDEPIFDERPRRRRPLVSIDADGQSGAAAEQDQTRRAQIAAAAVVTADALNQLADPDAEADIAESQPSATPQPPATSAENPAVIEQALAGPIVFRELFPPPADPGLSFYGGRPIVPTDFVWPEHDGHPLHFVAQWDCTALAKADVTGLLPGSGVLYFFGDFSWTNHEAYRFIHVDGPAHGWTEIDPPAHLGPTHGKETAWQLPECSQHHEDEGAHVPNLFPRWPFTPLAIDYPLAEVRRQAEEDEEPGIFWNDRKDVGELLLQVQNSLGDPLGEFDAERPVQSGRPFDAFPHDWAAVRIVTARAMENLEKPDRLSRGALMRDMGEEERATIVQEWLSEARELFAFACQHDPRAVPDSVMAEDIWVWIEKIQPALNHMLPSLVEESVNTSLGLGSDAVEAIPQNWIAHCSRGHALAIEYMRDEYPDWSQPDAAKVHEEKKKRGELEQVRQLNANTPNRIFGPASYVQGYVEEMVGTHVLLLELSSNQQIGHHLGEGVLQFLIKPDDLACGRFDRVQTVVSAY